MLSTSFAAPIPVTRYDRLAQLLQRVSCPLLKHLTQELLFDPTPNVFRLNLLEWLVFSCDPLILETCDALSVPSPITRIQSSNPLRSASLSLLADPSPGFPFHLFPRLRSQQSPLYSGSLQGQ